MFLAIINDTYAEVKAEIATSNSEFEIADFFKKVINVYILFLVNKKNLMHFFGLFHYFLATDFFFIWVRFYI